MVVPTDPGGRLLLGKFFRALAEPTRLQLLQFVLHEEKTVGECVSHVGLAQGRVSTHLAFLAECGFIRAREPAVSPTAQSATRGSLSCCCWAAQ